MDRTGEVKKEVDKIFSNALKSKLSTNQKNAKKRVQKQEKKAATEAARVVAAEARKTKGLHEGRPPALPPPVIAEASSDSNSGSERPGLARIGLGRQRRACRVQAGMTSKRGCLCNFVAKQLYMDNSLCELQYHGMNHFNRAGQPCHGSSFAGFKHSLGARLSWRTRSWIRSMLAQGFSPAQVMAFHKKEAWECAKDNMPCSRDTFIMPDDVYNLCKKRATQLWQKHPRDPLSDRMWKEENEDSVYQMLPRIREHQSQ